MGNCKSQKSTPYDHKHQRLRDVSLVSSVVSETMSEMIWGKKEIDPEIFLGIPSRRPCHGGREHRPGPKPSASPFDCLESPASRPVSVSPYNWQPANRKTGVPLRKCHGKAAPKLQSSKWEGYDDFGEESHGVTPVKVETIQGLNSKASIQRRGQNDKGGSHIVHQKGPLEQWVELVEKCSNTTSQTESTREFQARGASAVATQRPASYFELPARGRRRRKTMPKPTKASSQAASQRRSSFFEKLARGTDGTKPMDTSLPPSSRRSSQGGELGAQGGDNMKATSTGSQTPIRRRSSFFEKLARGTDGTKPMDTSLPPSRRRSSQGEELVAQGGDNMKVTLTSSQTPIRRRSSFFEKLARGTDGTKPMDTSLPPSRRRSSQGEELVAQQGDNMKVTLTSRHAPSRRRTSFFEKLARGTDGAKPVDTSLPSCRGSSRGGGGGAGGGAAPAWGGGGGGESGAFAGGEQGSPRRGGGRGASPEEERRRRGRGAGAGGARRRQATDKGVSRSVPRNFQERSGQRRRRPPSPCGSARAPARPPRHNAEELADKAFEGRRGGDATARLVGGRPPPLASPHRAAASPLSGPSSPPPVHSRGREAATSAAGKYLLG